MRLDRTANILGALALALADEIKIATESQTSEGGPAPAAITLIGHEPGMTIDVLRRALGLSHSGAVRLVDRLAGDGLIERRPAPHDGRAVALRLTLAGEDTRVRMRGGRRGALEAALDALTPYERRRLAGLAEKMLAALLRDSAHAYAVCRLCDEEACSECPVECELNRRAGESEAVSPQPPSVRRAERD